IPQPLQPLAFSPDGKLFATSGGKNQTRIRVCETATGRQITALTGHDQAVLSLEFTADAAFLLSGSADRTALVWNLRRPAGFDGEAGTDKEVREMWGELRDGDAREAYRSICRLALCPQRTVAFFRKNLRTAPPREVKRIQQLIAELDSDKRAARDR